MRVGTLSGAVGPYSPYPRSSSYYGREVNVRDSIASMNTAIEMGADGSMLPYSNSNSRSDFSSGSDIRRSLSNEKKLGVDASLLWTKDSNLEADDYLHNPDAELDKIIDNQFASRYSTRGLLNVFWLVVVVGGLIGVFVLFPITTFVFHSGYLSSNGASSNLFGWGLGGINASGQIPR